MKNEDKLNLIYDKYRENKNSHVYLVETNSIDNALEDIKNLIIKINIDNKDNNIQSLVENNNLPTLSVIWPDNQEIKKDSIEELIEKLHKIPVITKENYFIICDAEKLNAKSGNLMLKIIEEPESDILGFFICNSSTSMLKTIQSRSQYISLRYNITKDFDEEMLEDVLEYYGLLHNVCSIEINKKYVDKYKDINTICSFLDCLVLEIKKHIDTAKTFDIIKKESKVIDLIFELESNIRKNGNISLLFDKFVIEVSRL